MRMNRVLSLISLALVVSLLSAFPAMGRADEGSGNKEGSALKSSVALGGYCPVAYHKMGKAVKGKKEFSAQYEGKTYYFVKKEARDAFKKAPTKFLPVLEGNCVVCKVKMSKDIPGNPSIFSVYQQKLYLFKSEDQKKMFDDKPSQFAQAIGMKKE